jgi:hypothetical protein
LHPRIQHNPSANTGTTIWAGTRFLGLRDSGSGAAFTYQFAQFGTHPPFSIRDLNAIADVAPMARSSRC